MHKHVSLVYIYCVILHVSGGNIHTLDCRDYIQLEHEEQYPLDATSEPNKALSVGFQVYIDLMMITIFMIVVMGCVSHGKLCNNTPEYKVRVFRNLA